MRRSDSSTNAPTIKGFELLGADSKAGHHCEVVAIELVTRGQLTHSHSSMAALSVTLVND